MVGPPTDSSHEDKDAILCNLSNSKIIHNIFIRVIFCDFNPRLYIVDNKSLNTKCFIKELCNGALKPLNVELSFFLLFTLITKNVGVSKIDFVSRISRGISMAEYF